MSILLEEIPLQIRKQIWIEQDGASPHFSRQVTAFLKDNYPNRWIGRGATIA